MIQFHLTTRHRGIAITTSHSITFHYAVKHYARKVIEREIFLFSFAGDGNFLFLKIFQKLILECPALAQK